MKKHPGSEAGYFGLRLFGAFILCIFGASLAVMSTAAPKPSKKSAARTSSALQPTVARSLYNGVSPALRDLPATGPITRDEIETELRPVRPGQPVPENFIDAIVQTSLGALAMPAPAQTFDG